MIKESYVDNVLSKLNSFHTSPKFAIKIKMMMVTAQKMMFSITNFFSKCDQIRRKIRIWSHLLKKSVMKNFFFCAVGVAHYLDLKLIDNLKLIHW